MGKRHRPLANLLTDREKSEYISFPVKGPSSGVPDRETTGSINKLSRNVKELVVAVRSPYVSELLTSIELVSFVYSMNIVG